MTNLKKEIQNVEGEVNKLKNELILLDKDRINMDIKEDKNLIRLLENLLDNEEIQKKYPKFNKLKKLFYILPSALVGLITILLIIASLLIGNITFTTFLPVILLAVDYVVYHTTTKIFDKKIEENDKVKPYYDIYGDKEYSAKRTLKDLREKEKELEDKNTLLEECTNREKQLTNLETILEKLYAIRDSYIEQTLGDKYKEEILELSNQFEQEKPKVLKKN